MAKSVKRTGLTNAQILAIFEKEKTKTDVKMLSLAEKTVNRMRYEIKRSTKRAGSTGNLAGNIKSNVIYDRKGHVKEVGIVDTDHLNQTAPYWYVVNYGATVGGTPYVPPVTRGNFKGSSKGPQEDSTGKEAWATRKNGKYFMIPKKSIKPMYFIQKTQRWLKNYFKKN